MAGFSIRFLGRRRLSPDFVGAVFMKKYLISLEYD